MNNNNAKYRGWEYCTRGDYHRNIDPDWSYAPTYIRKMRIIPEHIEKLPRDAVILDAGCGEGV